MDFIVTRRGLIEKIFAVLVVICLLSIPLVGVNYDLTKYLPDRTDSAKALDIMEQEFTYPGIGRVMLQDVTLYEAKNIKDRIADVDGVDMVMWCDLTTNIYASSAFVDYSNISDYYKDGCAYMDVIFTSSDSSDSTHAAVRTIEQIIGSRGVMAGSAVSDTTLGPTLNQQIGIVSVLAVIVIFLILTLTTNSWFEPVLFLFVMGVAIALGMGSNLLFGEISFMSNSVGAILQLACSMDYSIFLLHAFTRERAQGIEPEQAMANALRTAVTSIGASGATTIVGFAVMAFMEFTLGRDLGFVLAKAIILSLFTVLCLMPALILRFQGIIAKTRHRPFLPSFRKFAEVGYRIRIPIAVAVLLLVVPCYVAQSMSDFTYGNEALSNSQGTAVYEAGQKMDAVFGKSNMMIALIPLDNPVTERTMTQELDDLPYVRYAISLSSVLPEGVPEQIIPNSLTSMMHGENWARVIINVNSDGESDAAFAYADELREIVASYYPGQTTYLVGTTPATQDIKDVIIPDNNRVTLLSLLGVAFVVGLTYKSIVLPFVVLIPIESANFINTAFPYLTGTRSMYLGFIIVGCIQLGATIDYSILLAGNYLNERARTSDKREAAIAAIAESAASILTSGTILSLVGYSLYFITSIDAIGGLGHLIGRGALIAMALVLFMLPLCLTIFDRFIVKSDHAARKHAQMNRIRATKLVLPHISALHEQRLKLRAQLRQNRQARWAALRNRLLSRKAPPTPPPENKENGKDDSSDET